jgi:hypothetical protein
VEPLAVELRLPTAVGAVPDGLEKRGPSCLGQPGTFDVLGQVALQRMMAGHLVELAALLVESHPEPPLLVEEVANVHAAGGGYAGEREHHHADEGTIAQPHHRLRLNRAQQLAGFLGRQDRRLALAELLARGFDGERRVVLEHAASDQMVEQRANGGHVLLEGGGRQAVGLGGLQVVAHVEGADFLDALLAAVLEEGKERAQRPAVGSPRIVVVDGGAQEVLDAIAGLAAGSLDDGRRPTMTRAEVRRST